MGSRMTARVGVGALLGLTLAACASTHATGLESPAAPELVAAPLPAKIGRASCRERVSLNV